MTDRTYVHEALERVGAEQDHVSEELAAYDRFADGVDDLEPVVSTDAMGAAQGGGGGGAVLAAPTARRKTAGANGTDRVRELFAETVRPYSVADVDEPEPLVETIAEELGEGVAMALAPTTPGRLTPEVKDAIHSATDQRRAELRVMDRALEAERKSLTATVERLEPILEWLVSADETPLMHLGFEELRARHERLEAHRVRCEGVVRDRQEVLGRTTGHNVTAGLAHRPLVEYLYRELPTPYPVLSTVVRLVELCIERQHHLRDHLTRRV